MKKEFIDTAVLLLGGVILYLFKELAVWTKGKLTEHRKPFKMVFRNRIDLRIKEVLTEIAHFTKASRCYLLSYHNSIKSHVGVCHDFVSMVNEYNRPDLPPMMKDFQSIPTGLFLDLIKNIEDIGFVKVEKDEQSNIGGFHRAYGFGDSYKARVGKTVANGTISIVFDDLRVLDEEEIQFIKDRLILINTLLNKKK